MVSIVSALRRIKRELGSILDRCQINRLCEAAGYRPRGAGPLEPATTVELFAKQVLQGNVSCAAVRHLDEQTFTSQAYCAARMRLPLKVVRQLVCDTSQQLCATVDSQEQYRFGPHRVLLIDSSNFSMPDTPELQRHFGQPGMQKVGCGFPIAHWLVLFNARTGLAIDTLTAPLRTHEASLVGQIQQQTQAQDLVVGEAQKKGHHGSVENPR